MNKTYDLLYHLITYAGCVPPMIHPNSDKPKEFYRQVRYTCTARKCRWGRYEKPLKTSRSLQSSRCKSSCFLCKGLTS